MESNLYVRFCGGFTLFKKLFGICLVYTPLLTLQFLKMNTDRKMLFDQADSTFHRLYIGDDCFGHFINPLCWNGYSSKGDCSLCSYWYE